jgi:hypothetical protein
MTIVRAMSAPFEEGKSHHSRCPRKRQRRELGTGNSERAWKTDQNNGGMTENSLTAGHGKVSFPTVAYDVWPGAAVT